MWVMICCGIIIYVLVLSLFVYVSFLLNYNIMFWVQRLSYLPLESVNKHLLEKKKEMNVYVQLIELRMCTSIHNLYINKNFTNQWM